MQVNVSRTIVSTANGEQKELGEYVGKVLLIVNLSSMLAMLFGTIKKDNKKNDLNLDEDISESISLPVEPIDSSNNNE